MFAIACDRFKVRIRFSVWLASCYAHVSCSATIGCNCHGPVMHVTVTLLRFASAELAVFQAVEVGLAFLKEQKSVVKSWDVPNIRFIFALVLNSAPNSMFVFGE